ncbi:MAG: hypothetical protein KJ697_04415 [Nanoarchaeota archaeon]|nr:hypothetical protein [Nanoarchaeota archaeon]MBU4002981.1 hypothetical protein [Pseudomonadota bacterium]
MKRTKEDKKFMIELDRSNRDYVMSMSTFMLATLVSTTALMISVYSFIYALNGWSTYTIIVGIIFTIVLSGFWISIMPRAKQGIRNAKKINEQFEKELLELYPEYKTKYH